MGDDIKEKVKPQNIYKATAFDSNLSKFLIVASLIGGGVFAIIASKRALTNLEAVLMQFFTLGSGLLGSFILGRQSIKKAVEEMIKPHAKSAFRRSWSLYQSL